MNFSSPNMSLFAPCNSDCKCSPHHFDPVCGADKILYYSPCFAGCSNESRLGDVKVLNKLNSFQQSTLALRFLYLTRLSRDLIRCTRTASASALRTGPTLAHKWRRQTRCAHPLAHWWFRSYVSPFWSCSALSWARRQHSLLL